MPQLPSSCLLSCHNRISLNFGSAGTFRLLCPPYKSRRLYGCWRRRSGLLLWWKIYLEHFLLTFPKSQLFQSDDQENRQIRLPPLLLLKKKSQLIDDEDDMMNVCSIQMDFAVSFPPTVVGKFPFTPTYKYNVASLPVPICLPMYNSSSEIRKCSTAKFIGSWLFGERGLFGTSLVLESPPSLFLESGNRQQKKTTQ